VNIAHLTLHVGLGTFLPIKAEELEDHKMHFESVSIPLATIESVKKAKAEGKKVWALGTTVTRSLEAWALDHFVETESAFTGRTDLYILPSFEYLVVDRLLTNFHQPKSTLLALVMAFAGIERTRSTYAWAIEREFRLFSYGDLSAWSK
jgi:S-adenosylmethionine:tRNA ribosyltransferase-isomerase